MGEITVTLRLGRQFESPEIAFRGSPGEVRTDLIGAFGLTQQGPDVSGLTLMQLINNVARTAQTLGILGSELGAVVVEPATAAPTPQAPPIPDPWDEPASDPEPESDPTAWIMAQIKDAATVPALKKVWADNQSFFSDAAVMAAWKARGKQLQAQGA